MNEQMHCPEPMCQKKLNGHHVTLFGEDGLHGIAGSRGSLNKLNEAVKDNTNNITKKVSSVKFYTVLYGTLATLIFAILVIVSPYINSFLRMWDDSKKLILQNHEQIVRINKTLGKTDDKFKKILRNQKNILEIIKKKYDTKGVDYD